MFQAVSDSDSLEIRQRLTENHLAMGEAAYSLLVLDALAANDARRVADMSRSYVAQQRTIINRNAWGLTPQEVADGLTAGAADSVAALDDLANINRNDLDAAATILSQSLPAMGVSSDLLGAKLGGRVIRQ